LVKASESQEITLDYPDYWSKKIDHRSSQDWKGIKQSLSLQFFSFHTMSGKIVQLSSLKEVG
jgi:hypothetical protein